MAQNLIKKEDICEKFIVTEKYGENAWNWPRETIAAFKIRTDKDGTNWLSQVYRNDFDEHAEVKLIECLRWDPDVLQAKKIEIEVYINYSPCSQCSQTILDYVNAMQLLKRNITITIAFANFYKTHPYKTKFKNHETKKNKEEADTNIEGLIKLHEKDGVSLELLGEHVKWEKFLDRSEFFSLTDEKEKKECLDKACSKERKDRETVDKTFWGDKISGVGELTSALAASKISAK